MQQRLSQKDEELATSELKSFRIMKAFACRTASILLRGHVGLAAGNAQRSWGGVSKMARQPTPMANRDLTFVRREAAAEEIWTPTEHSGLMVPGFHTDTHCSQAHSYSSTSSADHSNSNSDLTIPMDNYYYETRRQNINNTYNYYYPRIICGRNFSVCYITNGIVSPINTEFTIIRYIYKLLNRNRTHTQHSGLMVPIFHTRIDSSRAHSYSSTSSVDHNNNNSDLNSPMDIYYYEPHRQNINNTYNNYYILSPCIRCNSDLNSPMDIYYYKPHTQNINNTYNNYYILSPRIICNGNRAVHYLTNGMGSVINTPFTLIKKICRYIYQLIIRNWTPTEQSGLMVPIFHNRTDSSRAHNYSSTSSVDHNNNNSDLNSPMDIYYYEPHRQNINNTYNNYYILSPRIICNGNQAVRYLTNGMGSVINTPFTFIKKFFRYMYQLINRNWTPTEQSGLMVPIFHTDTHSSQAHSYSNVDHNNNNRDLNSPMDIYHYEPHRQNINNTYNNYYILSPRIICNGNQAVCYLTNVIGSFTNTAFTFIRKSFRYMYQLFNRN